MCWPNVVPCHVLVAWSVCLKCVTNEPSWMDAESAFPVLQLFRIWLFQPKYRTCLSDFQYGARQTCRRLSNNRGACAFEIAAPGRHTYAPPVDHSATPNCGKTFLQIATLPCRGKTLGQIAGARQIRNLPALDPVIAMSMQSFFWELWTSLESVSPSRTLHGYQSPECCVFCKRKDKCVTWSPVDIPKLF